MLAAILSICSGACRRGLSDDERTAINTMLNRKPAPTLLHPEPRGLYRSPSPVCTPTPRAGDIPLRAQHVPATVAFPETPFSYARAMAGEGRVAHVPGDVHADAFAERVRELAHLQRRSIRKEKWAFAQWKLLTGLPHPYDPRFK